MVVFWFAVHIENLDIARYLLQKEQLIKQLVATLYVKEQLSAAKLSKEEEEDDSMSLISQRNIREKKRPSPRHNSEYDDEVLESSQQLTDEIEMVDRLSHSDTQKRGSENEENQRKYSTPYRSQKSKFHNMPTSAVEN
jgi:hypothetical protein